MNIVAYKLFYLDRVSLQRLDKTQHWNLPTPVTLGTETYTVTPNKMLNLVKEKEQKDKRKAIQELQL